MTARLKYLLDGGIDREATYLSAERETGGMESERYTCDACGKQFDAEADLRDHVHRVGLVE